MNTLRGCNAALRRRRLLRNVLCAALALVLAALGIGLVEWACRPTPATFVQPPPPPAAAPTVIIVERPAEPKKGR